MSQLSLLIEELCPDGVEYKTLGDVGVLIRGRRFTKADYVESGLGSIHYGEVYTSYGTSADKVRSFVRPELKTQLRLARRGDLVIAATGENVDEVGKAVAWLGDDEVAVHDDCYIFRHSLDPVFVAYLFQSGSFHAQKARFVTESKLARISRAGIAAIRIPVPPLEVQRQVVDILDELERLEAELEEELASERELRARQYTHYRSTLLTFERDGETEWSTLGAVCTRAFAGGTPLASKREYYDGGDIPWLRTQEVAYRDIETTSMKITDGGLANSSARWVRENSVIVAISGAGITRGRAAVNKIRLTTNQHCCNLEVDEAQAHYRYVFHWISHRYEDLRSRGHGNRNDLNVGLVKAYEIALPSLAEQRRIAETLDKLDALVHDLSSGLPAEIAARRKQYEYYRDLLLTFPEKKTAA
jgi:type I restriction enzyme S subunit